MAGETKADPRGETPGSRPRLAEAGETCRRMVESMPEGALTLTRDGLILFSNQRFASLLGMPLDRVIGAPFEDLVAPEDAFLLPALLAARSRSQAQIRLKGSAVALLSACPLTLEGADYVCLVVTDLSGLRRTEEERNASHAQTLQLVLDQIPQRIFWKDRAGRYLGCNKAFADDAGVPLVPSVVGKTAYDFSHWKAVAGLYAADDRQVVETGVPKIGYEEPLIGPDGAQRWLRSSKSPLIGAGGAVIGILGTYEDVTETKRAQEKLQRYSVELAGTNEDLRRFTQIVSHDLRAPLLNLKGFCAELRRSIDALRNSEDALLAHLPEPERAALAYALRENIPEALGFIETSITRMDSLTAALLRLSRVGRRELHVEELDCAAVLDETLRTLGHQIRSRGIEVRTGPLPRISGDRTAVEQIFGNLLDNAIKFLDPERPGSIEVSAEEKPDAAVFQVRDNGRGIAEDDMDKVFMPFRRLGPQDVPGEGMGLAFVRALLHRMGGRIECRSQFGVGTTFSFTLPKVK